MTKSAASRTRTVFAINRNVMHVSRNVGAKFPVCGNRRAVYCTRAATYAEQEGANCAKCAAVFARWEAKKVAAASAPSAYEVNTYDANGDAVLHVGNFDSILAARAGIAAHAGVVLDIDTYGTAVLPSIAESWTAAGTEYVVHVVA